MHLPRVTTLVIYLIALASASPIAWPDDKLEEVNALRVRGVSEVSRLSHALNFSPCLYSFCKLSSPRQADSIAFHFIDLVPILTHRRPR